MGELQRLLDDACARGAVPGVGALVARDGNIETAFAEFGDAGFAAAGDIDCIAVHLENVGDALGMVAVVIDDQNSEAHAVIPRRSTSLH